jgi:hypothetical protein
MRRVFFAVIASLLLPGLLAAYTIVLKSGERIEAQGRYTIEGNVARFVDSTGQPHQVPLAEIDVAATERANAPRSVPVPGRAEEPSASADARRKPKVWTNDEIEVLVRGQRISTVGEAVAAPAPSEGASEAGAPEGAAAEGEKALPPKEQTPEYWQERLKPLREELAKVEQELQASRSGQNQAASNAVNVNTNAPGVDVADTIARLEQRRAQLQRQVEDIQAEARRMGIPPGWVR